MCGASSKSLPRKFEKVANTPHAGIFVGSVRLSPQLFYSKSDGRSNHSTIRSPHPADVEGQGLLSIEDSAESYHNVVPKVLHRGNKGRKFY